jgi:hypothetical protein
MCGTPINYHWHCWDSNLLTTSQSFIKSFALLDILILSDSLFLLGLQPNEQQPVYRGLPVSAVANSLFDCNVSCCNMTCNGSLPLLYIKLELMSLFLEWQPQKWLISSNFPVIPVYLQVISTQLLMILVSCRNLSNNQLTGNLNPQIFITLTNLQTL